MVLHHLFSDFFLVFQVCLLLKSSRALGVQTTVELVPKKSKKLVIIIKMQWTKLKTFVHNNEYFRHFGSSVLLQRAK